MWQRGGFVPNEVTSPARSLNPMRVRSLGRRRHRTASPFPPRSWKREETHGLELFSSPSRGVTPHFSSNRTAVRGGGASERCPCRDEGAGRARDLARHGAASLFPSDSSLTS